MVRIFHPYYLWEDYKNGMYNTVFENYDLSINDAIKLLSDTELFYTISNEMVFKWKYCEDVNLTNLEQNRKAWIGQASCSFYKNVPQLITCDAWMLLTEKQRRLANNVADKIIKEYEARTNNTKQILLKL